MFTVPFLRVISWHSGATPRCCAGRNRFARMSRPVSADEHASRAVDRNEEQRPVGRTSAFEEAVDLVAEVGNVAQSLLPGLSRDPRNLRIAQDVSDVFGVYEERLRALKRDFDVVPDGPGLTNRELDFVRFLARNAKNARTSLDHVEIHASLALDRAYAAGAEVEKHLESLAAGLKKRPSLKTTDTYGKAKNELAQHPSSGESFRPGFNAPLLFGAVRFDFESRDTQGHFSAPEGTLRSLVLNSASPFALTVARGAPSPVHGVSGMAGVGKTTALIGLAHDRKIREHFVDGVLYVSVGAAATVEHLASELSKIMRVTGAVSSADKVESSSSLAAAVSDAAVWFNGKRILFLVDDIWPAATHPEGFLPDLQKILQGSPGSRMAISTRSRTIAVQTGSHVDFGTRDPQGPVAVAMFMSHAAPSIEFDTNHHTVVRAILDRCAGLPIAIAVTGGAVALRMSCGLGFVSACRTYFNLLVNEMHPGASFLDSAISMSLRSLEELSDKVKSGSYRYPLRAMYTSLCVLRQQQPVPVLALSRMWEVDESSAMTVCMQFSSMSLAKLSTGNLADGADICGLLIHDLQLEFCRNEVEESGAMKWHRLLLDGHCSHDSRATSDKHGDLGMNMLEFTPRHWWRDDMSNPEYIRSNLSYHLDGAGLHLELGAVVLDIRWLNARVRKGGILGIKKDFAFLQTALAEKDFSRCVQCIRKVLEKSAASIGKDLRVLSFILLSDLFAKSKTSAFLYRFLQQVKSVTPKPFLVPTMCSYKPPGEGLLFTMDLRQENQETSYFCGLDYSPCEQFVAAGAGNVVSVVHVETHDQVCCLRGHEDEVCLVKFNSNTSLIVSLSADDNVIVWDWKSKSTPFVMCPDMGAYGLGFSRDGSKILAAGNVCGVKIWDAGTGIQEKTLEEKYKIISVASSREGDLVAMGTGDKKVRVINWISGKLVFESLEHGLPNTVKFSPNGRYLAAVCCDCAVVWDSSNWDIVGEVDRRNGQDTDHLSFHPSADIVLLGTGAGEVILWRFKEIDCCTQLQQFTFASAVTGLYFRKKGTELIVGTGDGIISVYNWDNADGISDSGIDETVHVKGFVLSSNGARVAVTTYDGNISIWNSREGEEIARYLAPFPRACIALSPDGEMIAAGSRPVAGQRKKVQVWRADQPSGPEYLMDEACDGLDLSRLCFSPDGQKLLMYDGSDGDIVIFDLQTKAKIVSLKIDFGQRRHFEHAFYSFDEKYIVWSEAGAGHAAVWRLDTKEIVFDTAAKVDHPMSLSTVKNIIRSCGPMTNRLWPFEMRHENHSCSTNLDVDTILRYVPYCKSIRGATGAMYCNDVYVALKDGEIGIFKLKPSPS